MAAAIRFHLDENVHHAVARGLRLRGIDVTTATDAELIGNSDEDHLRFAVAEHAVLVTHDADLLHLHADGAEHAGIVFCAKDSRSIGDMLRFLCLLHDVVTPDEIRGQVEFM
jgi:uncharacterized protein with PIN domain